MADLVGGIIGPSFGQHVTVEGVRSGFWHRLHLCMQGLILLH